MNELLGWLFVVGLLALPFAIGFWIWAKMFEWGVRLLFPKDWAAHQKERLPGASAHKYRRRE